tara:strand:+ start:3459 stop:3881 length:423 start_codon:yes stop_codon:yes gene_type:complete
MELPFPLPKYHRSDTKRNWKRRGLVFENDLAFSIVYKRYIFTRQCELCHKTFIKSNDRQMDHDHDTGKFRNIVCRKCNLRKADRKNSNNTSGYKGIDSVKSSWRFQANINGKNTHIKGMKDKDKLIEFVEKWKVENNYHT